jgi:hypothetical protein
VTLKSPVSVLQFTPRKPEMQQFDKMRYSQEHIDLMERNQVRMEEAKKKMGTSWLLHPQNKVAPNTNVAKPILASNF